MKNSKKTWGILGTSMGSVLIIVALLTMVGMGSQDTYAFETCIKCPDGYDIAGRSCKKDRHFAVCSDSTCQARTGVPVGKAEGTCSHDTSGVSSCTVSEYTSCEKYGDDKPTDGDDDDKPSNPNKPTGGDDGTAGAKCEPGTYYDGNYGCKPCTEGFYCPGGTFSHSTADIDGSGRKKCPETATTCTSTEFTCSGEYEKNTAGTDCVKKTGGDDKPNNPNKPTGGDDKPSNPNKPTGGGDDGSGGNGGGNSGGNSGGNGNGGNTGGNNGNNNGGNNATKNPNTATKAPLVIALIGIISVGISTVVYFNGKKEINTEI